METQTETTSINALPNKYVGGNQPIVNGGNNMGHGINLETSELPRDIPMTTENVTSDAGVKVNFVPENENDVYYIPKTNVSEESPKSTSLFDAYKTIKMEELRIPLLVSLLYVMFSLPYIQNIFKKSFTFLVEEDKITSSGMYLLGGFFGLAYFGIMKVLGEN